MSRTLVLRGEPGMGKTALISYAASATDLTGFLSLVWRPSRISRLPGCIRLVSPLLHDARNLPQSQRTALEVAFGLATGPRPDQYLFALAVLTLLAGEAGDHGLLCLVDDAHVAGYGVGQCPGNRRQAAARRRDRDTGGRGGFRRSDQLPQRSRQPGSAGAFATQDAQALLAHWVGRALDPLVTRRIIDETQGCPLALLELARDLTDAELEWLALAPQPLPLGRRLEAHFLRRVRLLPAATQILLLIGAADASGDEALLHRAALALDVPADADAPAVDAAPLTGRYGFGFVTRWSGLQCTTARPRLSAARSMRRSLPRPAVARLLTDTHGTVPRRRPVRMAPSRPNLSSPRASCVTGAAGQPR